MPRGDPPPPLQRIRPSQVSDLIPILGGVPDTPVHVLLTKPPVTPPRVAVVVTATTGRSGVIRR